MTYDSKNFDDASGLPFSIYADTALKSREMDHDFPFAAAAFSVGSMFVGNTLFEYAKKRPRDEFGDVLLTSTLQTGLECLFASPGGLYYALSNRHPTIDK